jgi:hypothetical protein
VYAQHLTTIFAPSGVLDRHPWAWITKPLSFEEEERALDLLKDYRTTVQRAEVCCERLQYSANIILTRTGRGLEHAAFTLAQAEGPDTAVAARTDSAPSAAPRSG